MEIVFSFFHEKSGWELLAVFLGLAYLILAMKESLWCWPAAFISTTIYTWLFWHVSLLMDSALNIYYMLMALYGFWAWVSLKNGKDRSSVQMLSETTQSTESDERKDGKESTADETNQTLEPAKHTLSISTWNLAQHIMVIAGVLALTGISGFYLDHNTQAAWPYVDSFTTWASVLTTFMVARKILENWVYWIVIDFVAMLLYIERGLYPTAMLFFIYLILCVFGFFAWKKNYQEQSTYSEEAAVA